MSIAFRSNALESADGFKIDYVEYSVRALLNHEATVLFLGINTSDCFLLHPVKSKFGFQSYLESLNPIRRSWGRNQSGAYSGDIQRPRV